MFNKLLLVFIFLLGWVSISSQVPADVVYPRFRDVQPAAACDPTERTRPLIVYRSDSPAGTYYCTTAGTWARVDTGALLSLNGLTATTQTFAVPTAADTAAWSSATSTHTLSLPITSVSGSSRTNFFPNFSAANTLAKTPYSWSGTQYRWRNTALDSTFDFTFSPGTSSGDGVFTVGLNGGSTDAFIQVDGLNGEISIVADSAVMVTSPSADFSTAITVGGGASLTTTDATGTGDLVKDTSPTFGASATFTGLTASQAVFTDGSKSLVSVATTGTGNSVRSDSPVLSGTPSIAAATGTSLNLGGATVTDILTNTASLNFDLTAVVSQDLTISVTGAALGDTCSIGVPHASVTADTIFTCWASAADTVTIRALRMAGTPDPADGTFRVTLTKF